MNPLDSCAGYVSSLFGCLDEFEQELFITLLDKLVFAVVILGIAALGKLYFERYQKRQEYNKSRALKRLDCLSHLYRSLLLWHTAYESWWQGYYQVSIRLQQSEVADETEAARIRAEVHPKFEKLVERDREIRELQNTVVQQMDEYDFWLEDEILDKFNDVLAAWARLVKKLLDEDWPNAMSIRPEAMDEIKAIQRTIAKSFADAKVKAKSYL